MRHTGERREGEEREGKGKGGERNLLSVDSRYIVNPD